jgi:ADP-heptose:LPS heptosyltransferase
VRVGFWATGDFAEYHELSRKVFNHGVKAPQENISETDKSFLLVKKLVPTLKKPSRMELPSLPEAVGERVSKFLEGSGITPGDRVVCLHPTLQKRDNRWSPARYLELVSLLSKEPRLKFIVLHGKGEGKELSAFRESARPFSNVFIAPSNDLLFILSVAKRSDALVCGDSGLMHACSWVTRVAAVFGPSEPKRWGPSSLTPFRHQVFRKKDRRCDSVPAREVSAQVKKMLAKRSINDPRQVIFHGLIR